MLLDERLGRDRDGDYPFGNGPPLSPLSLPLLSAAEVGMGRGGVGVLNNRRGDGWVGNGCGFISST